MTSIDVCIHLIGDDYYLVETTMDSTTGVLSTSLTLLPTPERGEGSMCEEHTTIRTTTPTGGNA